MFLFRLHFVVFFVVVTLFLRRRSLRPRRHRCRCRHHRRRCRRAVNLCVVVVIVVAVLCDGVCAHHHSRLVPCVCGTLALTALPHESLNSVSR